MTGLEIASVVGMVVVLLAMAYLFIAEGHNLPGGFRS